MANILTVLQQFSAFGIDFPADAVIDSSITETWPEGTLNRRLNNKFLEFVGSGVTHVLVEALGTDGSIVLQYVPAGSEPEFVQPTPAPTPATPPAPAAVELTEEQKFQILLEEEEKRKAEGN